MSGRPRLALACATAAVFAFGLTGCGEGKTKVRGAVTHNGKSVVWGSVTLVDRTGQYHIAEIDSSGNYEIDDVPTGSVKLAVVSPNPEMKGRAERGKGGGGKAMLEDPREQFLAGKQKNAAPDRPPPPPGAWFPIPDKFGSPDTSGLTGEVKKGAPLDIALK